MKYKTIRQLVPDEIPVTGCILPWHIRTFVRAHEAKYLDPIPGMLILQCLMKQHEQEDDLDDSKRTTWLKRHFPEMDEAVIETFINLSDYIAYGGVYSHLPCLGWERLLSFVNAVDGSGFIVEQFAQDHGYSGCQNTTDLRAKVDAALDEAGLEPPRIWRPDDSEQMEEDIEGAKECGSCSGVGW